MFVPFSSFYAWTAFLVFILKNKTYVAMRLAKLFGARSTVFAATAKEISGGADGKMGTGRCDEKGYEIPRTGWCPNGFSRLSVAIMYTQLRLTFSF